MQIQFLEEIFHAVVVVGFIAGNSGACGRSNQNCFKVGASLKLPGVRKNSTG